MTARRTHDQARRLAHRRRAIDYIERCPLATTFAEFDRLNRHQRLKTVFLFSIKDDISPINVAHVDFLPWKKTIINEYEDVLAMDWEHTCIECRLPVGPWCY